MRLHFIAFIISVLTYRINILGDTTPAFDLFPFIVAFRILFHNSDFDPITHYLSIYLLLSLVRM